MQNLHDVMSISPSSDEKKASTMAGL